jgi:hypothetical protein
MNTKPAPLQQGHLDDQESYLSRWWSWHPISAGNKSNAKRDAANC